MALGGEDERRSKRRMDPTIGRQKQVSHYGGRGGASGRGGLVSRRCN